MTYQQGDLLIENWGDEQIAGWKRFIILLGLLKI